MSFVCLSVNLFLFCVCVCACVCKHLHPYAWTIITVKLPYNRGYTPTMDVHNCQRPAIR